MSLLHQLRAFFLFCSVFFCAMMRTRSLLSFFWSFLTLLPYFFVVIFSDFFNASTHLYVSLYFDFFIFPLVCCLPLYVSSTLSFHFMFGYR